ncbi:hypothetical protein CRUP_007941 [Coryphaenoides rupestris]|nr:hypothetical protein CRUP_007941 [Coryphaenoides rupestris]
MQAMDLYYHTEPDPDNNYCCPGDNNTSAAETLWEPGGVSSATQFLTTEAHSHSALWSDWAAAAAAAATATVGPPMSVRPTRRQSPHTGS